jgi:hypothetical protein
VEHSKVTAVIWSHAASPKVSMNLWRSSSAVSGYGAGTGIRFSLDDGISQPAHSPQFSHFPKSVAKCPHWDFSITCSANFDPTPV